jgi:hypothetical protein
MAFIGTPLDTRNTFQSLQGKRFNGDGSTTDFTLDVTPSSTLDIEVFVGNVRQDPNSAYTLSGTTLAFTGAPPSGTNNIYVVHQAKSVGTISVPDSYKSDAQTISGARTFNGGITMGGTTPTLTVGDAGAEDTKIVFDGNAQDFHIGLDDSTDSLTMGLGSTLGTTAHMTFDANGHILKPLQPGVVWKPTSNSSAIAADTTHTIGASNSSEIIDRNGDFSGNTFTAPVTGLYFLSMNLLVNSYDHDNNYSAGWIETSNRRYQMWQIPGNGLSADGSVMISGGSVADMDANDTAVWQFRNDQGAQQPVINQERTILGAFLLG